MSRFLLPAVVLTAIWALPACARRIEDWPYERLLKEADVVVIARPMSTKATGKVSTANPWEANFVEVETAFEVESALKGKVEGNKLTLLHYRLEPGAQIVNGPLLVKFRTRGLRLDTPKAKAQLGQPSYLLYLKKRADGRFEPLSGQVDPELSVREMYAPLSEDLGKDE